MTDAREAAAEAAAEAFDEWLLRMHGVASTCRHEVEGAAIAAAVLAAVEPLIRAEALAEIDPDPRHVIDFREDGWTIKHPLSCRRDLFACSVNRAAEQQLTEPPDELGRFECSVSPSGGFGWSAAPIDTSPAAPGPLTRQEDR